MCFFWLPSVKITVEALLAVALYCSLMYFSGTKLIINFILGEYCIEP